MFPSSHEAWRNKQNTVALLVHFGHMSPTIITAKLCALNSANNLVDVNMNVGNLRFDTYSEITLDNDIDLLV